jgi:hypothetical protein
MPPKKEKQNYTQKYYDFTYSALGQVHVTVKAKRKYYSGHL